VEAPISLPINRSRRAATLRAAAKTVSSARRNWELLLRASNLEKIEKALAKRKAAQGS
jgi:hypothetical protein